MSLPRTCRFCAHKPVVNKTVRYCYDCHPGGPIAAPPCRRCGSVDSYYSAGLCHRCHHTAPQPAESCQDCHAWGVTRIRGWLCHACVGWRKHNPTVGDCPICGEQRHLGRGGYCRLCWRTASTLHGQTRRAGRAGRDGREPVPLDVIALNRDGQQLSFAQMMAPHTRRGRRGLVQEPPQQPTPVAQRRARCRQLLLFDDNPPSWASRNSIPAARSPHLAGQLKRLAADIGAHRGWSRTSRRRVQLGLTALLGWQTTPGKPFRASDIARLVDVDLRCASLLRVVLTEAGLFVDDRTPAVDEWFTRSISGLPAPMAGEVSEWFGVLRQGSSTPPRYRPRHETTVRLKVGHALPALQAWTAAGHTSLREITPADVDTVLPHSGNPRALTGASLRSLFRVLKGRRVVFVNPIAPIATGAPERRQPLPADLDRLRAALHGDDAAAAALAALLAFHAIRPRQLRALQLTDIRDGRLHLDSRLIPLAGPVRDRLATWLDERARRWPRTVNPHLFIHQRTASVTVPVGTRWLALRMGMTAGEIRDDRILEEAFATGGDVRRLIDLFGVTVKTATRYTQVVGHPELRQTDT